MTKTTHWKRSKSTSSVKRKTRQLKNRVQQVHRRYCVFQDLPRSRFSPKPRSKQDQEHIFTSIQGQQEKFQQDTKGRPTGPTGSTRFKQVPPVKQDQARPNKTNQDQQSQPNTKQDKVSTKTNNQTRPSKTNKNCTNNKPTRPIQGSPSCQSHLPVRLRRPVFFIFFFLVCSLWLLSFFFL